MSDKGVLRVHRLGAELDDFRSALWKSGGFTDSDRSSAEGDGRTNDAGWERPAIYEEDNKRAPIGDLLLLRKGLLVVRKPESDDGAAVRVVLDRLGDPFPLDGDLEGLHGYRSLPRFGLLQYVLMDRDPPGGPKTLRMGHFDFDPEILPEDAMFRVGNQLFVAEHDSTDGFYRCVTSRGMTGITFEEVWNSIDGPAPQKLRPSPNALPVASDGMAGAPPKARADPAPYAPLTDDEFSQWQSHSQPAVRLVAGGTGPTVGRLGGQPTLDTTIWPTRDDGTPLSFLAMIDLDALAAGSGTPAGLDLPLSGTLSFFYEAVSQEAWGYDPAHRDAARVIWTGANRGSLVAAPDGAAIFAEVPLGTEVIDTLPGWEEDIIRDLRESNREGVLAMADDLEPTDPIVPHHQLGGWPLLVQAPLWNEAQLAANGMPAGGPADYSSADANALLQNANDWQLLLQLDTDDAAGWMWVDGGRLYFLIRKQDLADRNFDNTWTILQT